MFQNMVRILCSVDGTARYILGK